MKDEPIRWSQIELNADAVGKKDIVARIQELASTSFLKQNKVFGKVVNVAKIFKKEQIVEVYNLLFDTAGAFKDPDAPEEVAVEEPVVDAVKVMNTKDTASMKKEVAKFSKSIIRKGPKDARVPSKGDIVSCWYTGYLMNSDGTPNEIQFFDSNQMGKNKSRTPLKFPVGKGRVIRGWDEALLTMAKGEKSRLSIDSDWAYGRKGKPEAGIPTNTNLVFDIELVNIE